MESSFLLFWLCYCLMSWLLEFMYRLLRQKSLHPAE
jgi:hypothetical protein